MGILDTKLIDFEMVIIDKSAKVDKKTGAVRSNVKYGFKDTSGDMTLRELMETMSMAIRDIAVGTYADVLAYEKHNLFNPIFEVDKKRVPAIPAKVQPFSEIKIMERSLLTDKTITKVLLDIYKKLVQRSPRGTLQYESGHIVIHNNMIVADNYHQFQSYLETQLLDAQKSGILMGYWDKFTFVNVAPYAGFLERHGSSAKTKSNIKMTHSTDKNRRRKEITTDGTGKVRRPNGAYFMTHRTYSRIDKKAFLNASFDFNFGFTQLESLFINGSNYPFYQRSTGKVMRRDFAPSNTKYSGPYVYPYIEFKLRRDTLKYINR